MSRLQNLNDLDDLDRRLVLEARDASEHAYAPYSGFAVGAAVWTGSGHIFRGSNLENAAYALSICAEMCALACANSAGDFEVRSIAIVGHRFSGPPDSSMIVTPCGSCRQIITEVAQRSRFDIRIVSCNGDLDKIMQATISELLPGAFGPHNLDQADQWLKQRSTLIERVRKLRRNTDRSISGMGGV
jgi:cytidine deaminase